MTEDELKTIQKYYVHLSKITRQEENLQQSHSIDEGDEKSLINKTIKKSSSGKIKKIN